VILVDSKTGKRDKPEDFIIPLKRLGLPAEKAVLQFGDFAFVGRGINDTPVSIGIELKKFRDLIVSLRTGRLQGHQLVGLQQAFDYRWLIIEGSWKQGRHGELVQGKTPVHGRMTGAELEKRLVTLEVQGGLRIRHTFSRADTLRVLGCLYRWWTDRNLDSHDSHITIYHPPTLVPISQFRQTVSTLPGIGLKLSQAVEIHFHKSLRYAFEASANQWAEIEGIGLGTAEKIVNAIRGGK
jgi:ERCC4-type nuclease